MREKLYFGGEGKNGKTYTWMSIADAVIRSGNKVVCIESDDGVSKVADEWGITESSGKLIKVGPSTAMARPGLYLFPPATEWMEMYQQAQKVEDWASKGQLTVKDWFVWEGMDLIRSMVSGEYADRTASLWDKTPGKNMAPSSWNAFIARRLKGGPILEGSDYAAIDTEIGKILAYMTLHAPFNVVGTTGTEAFRTGLYKEDDQTREFYAAMGMPVKFSGQKDYVRKFDTLVVCGKSMTGYVFQVFGDRGSLHRGQSVVQGTIASKIQNVNFYEQFLVQKAGWPSMAVDRQVSIPYTQPATPVSIPPQSPLPPPPPRLS